MDRPKSNSDSYHIVVLGGGIHGVGVAQAAAAAGYRVLLVEQTELAAGTSSRSSKLIHGGLRYLENREFRLVYESLRERELLLKLAPTLVRRQPFYLPIYRTSRRRPWYIRLGLMAYSALTGFRADTGFRKVPRAQWDQLDGLRIEGLHTVFAYTDAQTDDRELTKAVMASAVSLGADGWCPARFVEGTIGHDRCSLVIDSHQISRNVTCDVVVNATGPWANDVLTRFQPAQRPVPVDLVQGTHVELPGTLSRGCYYCEAPSDHRAVFAMPWKDRTLVGTTEVVYRGDPAKVSPLPEEIDYLIETFRYYFPAGRTDPTNAWSGLRVLPASRHLKAFQRSRETLLSVDNDHHPRLLSIFGGKLTTYRATSERVLQRLLPLLPHVDRKAQTSELPLVSANESPGAQVGALPTARLPDPFR